MSTKTSKSGNLLSIIQNMYSRIVCTILSKRMQQYCARHQYNTHSDIAAQLSQQIDSIAAQQAKTNTKQQTHTANVQKQQEKTKHTTQASKPSATNTVDTKKANELSKYFKQRGNGATLNPGIENTLTHSIWEHIHLSLRQARQGNKNSAKMHADIANHAHKELAHYISEEKYIALTQEIENELKNHALQ